MTSNDKKVAVGSWVTLRDPDIGEETVQVVEKLEQAPSLDKVPVGTPFGQALLGAKAGEKVRFPLPDGGEEEVEVLSVGQLH